MEEYIGKYIYINTDRFWYLQSYCHKKICQEFNTGEYYEKMAKIEKEKIDPKIYESVRNSFLYKDSNFCKRYGNSYLVYVEDVKFNLEGEIGFFGKSYMHHSCYDDKGKLKDGGNYKEWSLNSGIRKSTKWFYWNDLEDLVVMNSNEAYEMLGDAILENIL